MKGYKQDDILAICFRLGVFIHHVLISAVLKTREISTLCGIYYVLKKNYVIMLVRFVH